MIDDIKKLIGGIVNSKNRLLFCNDQNIFSKKIILFDLEHNGWLGEKHGDKTELLEFCGLKIIKGKIVNSLFFKVKATKYEMTEEAKKNIPYEYEPEEYNNRKTIDHYINRFAVFLKGVDYFFSWDEKNDKKVLLKVVDNDFKKNIFSKSKYFFNIEEKINGNENKLKNHKRKLKTLFISLADGDKNKCFKIGKESIDLKDLCKEAKHSKSLFDVLQILYIIKSLGVK